MSVVTFLILILCVMNGNEWERPVGPSKTLITRLQTFTQRRTDSAGLPPFSDWHTD